MLVTHGYTSGHRMIESGAGSAEGAWSTLVGPGAPIDTDRCFVVCSNMLGSSYGSTNAASLDPRTGRPYGSRFPHITVADIVTAQRRLLEHLGVRHLRAVMGPSYGGFQAFQWAVTFPDFMDGVVPVVSSPRAAGPRRVADAAGPLRARSQLEWRRLLRHGGMHGDADGAAGRNAEALRHGREPGARFPDPAARERKSAHRRGWANEFDANSLFILGRAMEEYDVTRGLAPHPGPGAVRAVAHRRAVPAEPGARGDGRGCATAGVDATTCEIDSEHGHLASGADAEKWAPALRDFMRALRV